MNRRQHRGDRSRPGGGEAKRPGASEPKRLGALVNQLLARRGYAQVLANEGLQAAVVAELDAVVGQGVRAGLVKRGVLHIHAADSVTLQELTFRKRAILRRLQHEFPTSGIRDLRFHVSASAGPSPGSG